MQVIRVIRARDQLVGLQYGKVKCVNLMDYQQINEFFEILEQGGGSILSIHH